MASLPQPTRKVLSSTLLLLTGLAVAGNVFSQPIPRILSNGIVNGAGAPLAPAAVAPGSIISIYGSKFNSSPGTHAGGLSATSAPLPSSLGGTQVLINSRLAPLYYVDSTQINAEVPWEVAGASYLTVQVIVNELVSNLSMAALAANAPGISVVTHGLDGSPVSSSQPATPGEYLTIYATGLGPVTNPPPSGAAALVKPLSTTLLTPVLTIGGISASVIFSGLTPGFSGLYQVNAQVPNGVPTHWAVTGKGSASAYYLPQESGQPEVPSRGSYCLRLTASDTAAAISATSDLIAVTPNTLYTTTASLRFAWSGDSNPSAKASTRPQVFTTIHYLNANGQPASTPSTVFSYFQENSTQGFQTFVFQYTTPSDARSVQIELGAACNGLAVPIVVDVDNLR
jgi:uncharacterized protein (TIGR03437 family)